MISWSLVSPITNLLDTQYTVRCVTSNINPILVYWTVHGVNITNTNYTQVNETDSTYNSTLLLYPNNELGQSVTITCSVEGVKNADSVILKGAILLCNTFPLIIKINFQLPPVHQKLMLTLLQTLVSISVGLYLIIILMDMSWLLFPMIVAMIASECLTLQLFNYSSLI